MSTSQQPVGGSLGTEMVPVAPGVNLLRSALILLAFAVAAAVPLAFASSYQLFQLTLAGTYAIAILGLNVVTGFNGQISLGHGAFYAIGAYASAILTLQGVSFWLALPAAALIAALVGGLVAGCGIGATARLARAGLGCAAGLHAADRPGRANHDGRDRAARRRRCPA